MDKSIASQIRAITRALTSRSETPQLDAEVLACHALGKPRSYLRAWPEEQMTQAQISRYQQLAKRRWKGEPIAYITGEREFWSLPFTVTPNTLIPRPETELLVERALHLIPDTAEWSVLELGAGCGAVAVVLAKERPGCQVTAVEASAATATVARSNARAHDVRNVKILTGDWFDPIWATRFAIIVSNPPYVAENDPHLESGDVRFEPERALVSGADGLNAIRMIIRDAPDHLVHHGGLLLEHAPEQKAAIHRLLIAAGFTKVETFEDLAGKDRVTVARYG